MSTMPTPLNKSDKLPPYSESAAIALITDANNVRGQNEAVVRQTLISGLADMFPPKDRPWWVKRHIRGAEHYLKINSGGQSTGYADSVVGLTAIEYESDLQQAAKFTTGKHQVRQYCAGLLNTGADPTKIRGVLSDGVEWLAYKLIKTPSKAPGSYQVTDVTLDQIGPKLKCNTANKKTARQLVTFLAQNYGREGTRPLTARSVVEYLGVEEAMGKRHLGKFEKLIRTSLAADKEAAKLLEHIWNTFVSHLSIKSSQNKFDISTYAQEFYVAVLAKLLCANVLESRSLAGDPIKISSILKGDYFASKGLLQFIEHDYFGWLNRYPYLDKVARIAKEIQADLAAYDFQRAPSDDLFGEFVAELAQKSQRVLLGQEFTPKALADDMAQELCKRLGPKQLPRFVDMCCGSGSMLVATNCETRKRLAKSKVKPGSKEYIESLEKSCTGFDIDPLAVVLAKVNWVQTNKDFLGPLDGSLIISAPVFHADSLFSLAPVFDKSSEKPRHDKDYVLKLYKKEIILPRYLVQPNRQRTFDLVIDNAYAISLELAKEDRNSLQKGIVDKILDSVQGETNEPALNGHERLRAKKFLNELIECLADLQRNRRNGVWAFIIRNAYRPGLVAGQFNGLISNPPWLAMSKIANNPFKQIIEKKAKRYGLTPGGSASPHVEMATVFLVHAVEHYLEDGALVASVLPDTVRNGNHHQPFRAQTVKSKGVTPHFKLRLKAIWVVEKEVFKNRAIVLFGIKAAPTKIKEIPGRIAPTSRTKITHHLAENGSKIIWSSNQPGKGVPDGYPIGFVSQGADIMPRRLVFFETVNASSGNKKCTIEQMQPDSINWFLWNDAKKHKDFEVMKRTLSADYLHPVYLSKHLAPFALTAASPAVLPIARDNGKWRMMTAQEVALDKNAKEHFGSILEESDFSSWNEFWEKGLDLRFKLSNQRIKPGTWIVVYGAGGGIPAGTYLRYPETPVIFDQTLYWAICTTKDEAIYLSGLINSKALLERVSDFMPAGAFGNRHIHTLPLKAIPVFDPDNSRHRMVVQKTSDLITTLDEQRKKKPNIEKYFTTSISMNTRRQRIRAVITSLDIWPEYEQACASVYTSEDD